MKRVEPTGLIVVDKYIEIVSRSRLATGCRTEEIQRRGAHGLECGRDGFEARYGVRGVHGRKIVQTRHNAKFDGGHYRGRARRNAALGANTLPCHAISRILRALQKFRNKSRAFHVSMKFLPECKPCPRNR